jgi:hypothetical protein
MIFILYLIYLLSQLNYIILEHDYKICASRHPWRYEDCIVPEADRICYDLYKNAKAVFVQTSDHLDVFKKNDVPGNFISLGSSIWSDEDLDLLESIVLESEGKNRGWQYGIVESDNWIKNSVGAIDFCEEQNLNYELIPASNDRKEFLTNMSKYSTLAFFPIARESCCRLVVEARCLNMNVLTTKNYGAVLEPWFALHGIELINFLKKSTSANLEKMKEYLWK